MYPSEEQKQQVYKKWIDNGRPWFSLDKSKDPTAEERQIILEMKKKEQNVIPKPANQVRAFDRLLNDAADY